MQMQGSGGDKTINSHKKIVIVHPQHFPIYKNLVNM